jgi:ADP-ribose pyrophosphatase
MGLEKTRLQPWETLASREVFVAAPWIKLSVLQVQLPDGRIVDDYYQVRQMDYAGVFAQTPDGRIIVERQYKHGVGRVSLMLPGGVIEDGEDPLVTAQRELLEETGYVAGAWQHLGSFVTDANHLGARAHLFAARCARQVARPDSGDLEDIEVVLMNPDEIIRAVRDGDVAVLGAVAAIALALSPIFDIRHEITPAEVKK